MITKAKGQNLKKMPIKPDTKTGLSEAARAQAQENLKLNEVSYENGLSTLTDLLEAQAMLQQMNDQSTDARANYRNHVVSYLQVTGR